MSSYPGRPVGISLHFSKDKIPGPEVVRHLVVPLCTAPSSARLCSSAVRFSGRRTARSASDTVREGRRLVSAEVSAHSIFCQRKSRLS